MDFRIALLAPALMLAACGKGAPVNSSPDGPVVSEQPQSDGRAPSPAPGLNVQQAGELPSPDAGPRFVGRWAENEESCRSAPWQFTATTLRTADGTNCSLDRATEVPGGYEIQAVCTAKGDPAPETISIRFAESAKAMLFSSKEMGQKGLVFCGRDA